VGSPVKVAGQVVGSGKALNAGRLPERRSRALLLPQQVRHWASSMDQESKKPFCELRVKMSGHAETYLLFQAKRGVSATLT